MYDMITADNYIHLYTTNAILLYIEGDLTLFIPTVPISQACHLL